MKGLVYHGNRDIRIESVDEPEPGLGEVKLQVDYCGICATDIEEYLHGPKFISSDPPNALTGKSMPIITGHELTATVVDVGKGVTDIEQGRRVVINGVLTCERCRWCMTGMTQQCPSTAVVGFGLNGGLAEYLVWPASHVISIPDHVTSKEAALVEPLAVANHAMTRACLNIGDRVAVLGVGTVGILAMQIAMAHGAQVYAIDNRQMSLELARELGAEATISAEESDIDDIVEDLTDSLGFDVVVDAAGAVGTPMNAIRWARRGGRVVLVAIYTATPQFDFNSIVAAEKEVVGSIANNQHDVEAVVDLLSSGIIKTTPLISDIVSLDDVIDLGFKRMLKPTKDVFRILVSPSGGV